VVLLKGCSTLHPHLRLEPLDDLGCDGHLAGVFGSGEGLLADPLAEHVDRDAAVCRDGIEAEEGLIQGLGVHKSLSHH